MPTPEYDLHYLEGAFPELEAYLLSSELYWPVSLNPPSSEPAYPRLTLGNLLLACQRLRGLPLDTSQTPRFLRADNRLQAEMARWRVRWGEKAAREFSSRLRQWGTYLEEFRQHPDRQADYYPYEVRLRLLLALLQPTAEDIPPAELDLLDVLDTVIKSHFVPSEFIWEPELALSFPPDAYWYLYGQLSAES